MLGFQYNQREKEKKLQTVLTVKLASLRCFVKQWPQNSNFKEERKHRNTTALHRKYQDWKNCYRNMNCNTWQVCQADQLKYACFEQQTFFFSPPVSPYLMAVRKKTGYPLVFFLLNF